MSKYCEFHASQTHPEVVKRLQSRQDLRLECQVCRHQCRPDHDDGAGVEEDEAEDVSHAGLISVVWCDG